jgi:hypothetical protein
MKIAASVVCLLYTVASVDAFVPPSRQYYARRHIALFDNSADIERAGEKDTKQTEKLLREEIAARNSKVENEEKYAVADGEKLEIVDGERKAAIVVRGGEEGKDLEATLERLAKTRAYSIFLAEKAAEIVEGLVDDFKKGSEKKFPTSGRKEKIVILGTGWGAASFLKDIDTDLVDVTVISPHNYFLFTPMLAGASIGIVAYQSITEFVREVIIGMTELLKE